MQFIPNLNFQGQCEEAFNFYAKTLQAENTCFNRYKEMPSDPKSPIDPVYAEQIMHTGLIKDGQIILMGADLLPIMYPDVIVGNNVEICITPENKAESDRLFAALSEGGTITMPIADQFWGDYFGSCRDKFGIGWMINCSSKQS